MVLHGARLRGRKEGRKRRKEGRKEGRKKEGKEGRQAQNTKNLGILRHQKRR